MSKIKIIFIYVSLEVSNFFRKVKELTKSTWNKMITTIKRIIHKCKCKCKHEKEKKDDTLK